MPVQYNVNNIIQTIGQKVYSNNITSNVEKYIKKKFRLLKDVLIDRNVYSVNIAQLFCELYTFHLRKLCSEIVLFLPRMRMIGNNIL